MKYIIFFIAFLFFSAGINVYADTPAPLVKPVNLNTADVFILSHSIKGIGLKRAEAIIKYRETHQGFKSLDELSAVPGLGGHFMQKHGEEIKAKFVLK